MVSESRKKLIFLLLSFCYFSFLFGKNDQIDSIDPEIRFQFPWTPIHESSDIKIPFSIDLGGKWKYIPDPDESDAINIAKEKINDYCSYTLEVPSSCIGWGFDAEESGLFIREVDIPNAWSSRQIKLKCEGMFERARIFINGKSVKEHIGWTPFERDITRFIRIGQTNRIAVYITMEGYSPNMRYRIRKGGYPDLGGILRPISMVAVPQVYVSDIFIIPRLDKEKSAWSLETQIALKNSLKHNSEIILKGYLKDSKDSEIPLSWLNDTVTVSKKKRDLLIYSGSVDNILPWTAETPNLYYLVLSLINKKDQSIIPVRFGFRTIEIKEEKVLLNGKPILMRGIAYKGGHADYGNASPYSIIKEEIELMKQANINTVRPGWAFKSPELHEVCDEKGMYVMSGVGGDQFHLNDNLTIQQFCEAFMRLKNCPSILIWELQNENPRKATQAINNVMEIGRGIDPYRSFCHPGANYEGLDFNCPHYLPKLFFDDKRDGRPFIPTEYAHTPSYELDLLKFDPGIHDLWGYSIKRGWDIVLKNPWVAGVITFAWRDPYIRDGSGHIVPALHHESRWGIVDELFTLKPEYHHLFKVYSPVKVSLDPLVVGKNKVPSIEIENCYDFTNLKSLDSEWKIFDQDKVIEEGKWELDIPPRSKKELTIPGILKKKKESILQLSFKDSWDRLVQCVRIPFVWEGYLDKKKNIKKSGKLTYKYEDNLTGVVWSNGVYYFDKTTGFLRCVEVRDQKFMMAGPHLNQRIAFPRAGRWFDWRAGVSVATENWTRRIFSMGLVSFDIHMNSDKTEAIIKTIHKYHNGNMTIVWNVRSDGQINMTCTLPPQGYGLSFRFPVNCRIITDKMRKEGSTRRFSERIAWRHCGLWSWLPENHLARNVGVASFLRPHDPQNHAMKINTAFLSVGPNDKSVNLVIQDPDALIHTKCHYWYNEFEVFIQGRLEDDYDYFDRTSPLKALPHALSEDQRTYSFIIRFVDKKNLEKLEKQELNLHHALIERNKFWQNYVDDLTVDDMKGTVKGLPPNYPE
jgi:hypothetical protein